MVMPDERFLAATRASYDVMASEYAQKVGSDLDAKPLDRALLAAFAELAQAGGNGPVADVGCGPGQVTAVLRRLGLNAFGIDLSLSFFQAVGQSFTKGLPYLLLILGATATSYYQQAQIQKRATGPVNPRSLKVT